MKIEKSTSNDPLQIALCHRRAFPESLSSQLHNPFTMKMLSWYLNDGCGVLFHVQDEDAIIGY